MIEDRGAVGIDAAAIRPIKQFKWLLDDDQKFSLSNTIRSMVPVHSSLLPALKTDAHGEGDTESLALCKASSILTDPSSSSSRSKNKSKTITPVDGSHVAKESIMAKFFIEKQVEQ